MGGAGGLARRYSAFISYSHRDEVFARRLHNRLESYRLPERLAPRAEEYAFQRRRLRPVFRDQDELTAAADLPEAVREALAASANLIVIGSPHSATSSWVGREIELFRELHGHRRILVALYQGTPETAFHPALREGVSGDGRLEPLAADFREASDARLAFLKIVAALAGVHLDALVQRDAQRRIRRIAAVSVAALAGMTVMGGVALAAIAARIEADHERVRSEAVIEFMLTDLRTQLKHVGSLKVLGIVNQAALKYYNGQDLRRLMPPALAQRARLLQDIGEDDEQRGDLNAARGQFLEALRTTTTLLDAHPDDPKAIFAQAQSEYWTGFIAWRQGDARTAQVRFDAYQSLAQKLVRSDPNNPDWLMEAGYAASSVGMLKLRQSLAIDQARSSFTTAQQCLEAALRRRPKDADIAGQVADGYAWLADVARLSGDYVSALAYRDRQRRILTALLGQDPRNSQTQLALSSNDLALARLAIARREYPLAFKRLLEGHSTAAALAKADPENTSLANEARIFELFEAYARLAATPIDAARAQAIVGDCASVAEQRDEELRAFCNVLRVRTFVAQGQAEDAKRLEDTSSLKTFLHGNVLTDEWHLSAKDELKL